MKKSLKNLVKLSSKVEIFIPSTKEVDKKTSNLKQVNKALKLLSELFGGATSTKALGSWLTDKNGLVKEKVDVVFAYCNETQLEEGIEKVIEFAEQLKVEMTQEAIAITVNNEMYFI